MGILCRSLLRYPLLYHPPPQKEGAERPELSYIWALLFWDGGGIEGGTFEVYDYGVREHRKCVTAPKRRWFQRAVACGISA